MADPVAIREVETACGRRVGSATLRSPGTLNALSLEMVDRLQVQLTRWAAEPDIVVVWLEGEGDKAFCAGGDLQELYQSLRECGSGANPYARQFFSREYRLDYLIHTYPKPLLCWGNGIVMGGGMGLMAGASHRVVTERTRMAMPEIGIGLFPDVGGSWFLNRLPARTGLFLALTGAPLDAADALFAGLADFRLPSGSRAALLEAMAQAKWHEDKAANSRLLSRLIGALAGSESTSAESSGASPSSPKTSAAATSSSKTSAAATSAAATSASSNLKTHFDEIRRLMGHDSLNDVAARLHEAANGETWIGKAAANFAKGSPTSARLAFALLQRARHLSLREVFQMELDVALGCCAHHDFAEGIRALLIDKDRKPRWQPARLQDVDDQLIADHFKPRNAGPSPLADLR
jgi:enoyl-CoA hydratase/carnithine racemase